MPSPLRPNVSDVTEPHLIRRTHSKAAGELVGNIRLLHLRLFIGRRARLFADQPQLSHQMTHLEPAYLNAAFLQHVPDRAAASRLTTLFKDLVHTAAQAHAIDIDVITSSSMSVVTGSRHIKHGTDQIHRLMRAELVNQRIRSISSDIKSAVAFFKMAFSRSRRLIFASSSWIFCCSGVSALLCGVTPCRSWLSCRTQRRSTDSTTPNDLLASKWLYPCSNTTAAASRLNSAENVRRCLLIRHLSGNHNRLSECPDSLDHYRSAFKMSADETRFTALRPKTGKAYCSSVVIHC